MRFLRPIRSAGAVLLLGGTLLGTACTEPRGRLYVRIGPPAPVFETRVVAPGPGYVWIEGHHEWDGNRYVWRQGYWALPPRPRAVWEAGHWSRDRRGWYWVDGHWR